jgi:hypothetical protein
MVIQRALKPFMLLVLIPLLSFCADHSQNNVLNNAPKNAVLLQFQNLFTIVDFLGGTISYKRTLSSTSAIRCGLSLFFSAGDHNDKWSYTYNYSLYNYTRGSKGGGLTGGLTVEYLRPVNPSNPVVFYYGAGISLDGSYSKSQWEENSTLAPSNYTSKYFGGGIVCPLGIEWKLLQYFSLLVDYSIKIRCDWRQDSGYSENGNSYGKTRNISLEAPLTLGLSVYF